MDSLIDTEDRPPAEPPADVVALLAGAVEQARAAVVEFSGDTVGDYLGVSFDDESAATHRFLAVLTGYHGWQWAAVVAAYPGAQHATVSEVSPSSSETGSLSAMISFTVRFGYLNDGPKSKCSSTLLR